MRDTTQWRKDVDRSRRHLLEACRAGDMNAIAHATQALQVLLDRADRPQPASKVVFALHSAAVPWPQRDDGAGEPG
jgi:hypothetical protein